MRRIILLLFIVFFGFHIARASTYTVCQHVVSLKTETNASYYLKDICKNDVFKVVIPKGTKSFTLFFNNINEKYCCEGPKVAAVLSDSDSVVPSGSGTDVDNVIDWYFLGGKWSSDAKVALSDTFLMDPLAGSSLQINIEASGNGTSDEYYIVFKALTHIDFVQISLSVDSKTFDLGSCKDASLPEDEKTYKSYGCLAEKVCSSCSKEKIKDPIKISSATGYGASVGSSKTSTSTKSTYSTRARTSSSTVVEKKECHWVVDPEECVARLVCTGTTTGGSLPPPPKPCSGCCGGKVPKPFNTAPRKVETSQSGSTQEAAWQSPFAGMFSAKKSFKGGTSSSGGSSTQTTTKTISGKKTIFCEKACLSDLNTPKFYASEEEYLLGDAIPVAIYVPGYGEPVDVYAAIEDPKGNYWILTSNGAILYNGSVPVYASRVTTPVAAAFNLNQLMPIYEGPYTLYILVVPSGTSLDNLKDYILVYTKFNVKTR